MKTCSICNKEKPEEEYHWRIKSKGKRHPRCKPCTVEIMRNQRVIHAEAIRIREKERAETERRKEWQVKHRQENREHYRKYDREYYAKTGGHKSAKRRAKQRNATPSWLSTEHDKQIKKLYAKAKRSGMHVDHIVPLINDNVCGLHVPWNLQLLSPKDNLAKSNKHEW